ncbi:MAG: TonB system transport protein ExbD [Pseudomonadota bacterium]|jgi:biopolymer transport protein ExbD
MKIKRFDNINVVPFIDVMLVLLTIVLTVATFVAQGAIPLALPKANAKAMAEVKYIEISINANNELFFGKESVDLSTMKAKIDALGKDDQVVIRGDAASSFQNFVSIVGLLKDKGLEKITIITNQK